MNLNLTLGNPRKLFTHTLTKIKEKQSDTNSKQPTDSLNELSYLCILTIGYNCSTEVIILKHITK